MRKIALALLLAAACAHQPARDDAGTRRYTVLMSTNAAGKQVVTARAGETVVDYEFNDRGRGPKTHTVIRLDERGLPVSMITTGNDYMKQAVDERFSIEGDVARWTTSSESGEGRPGAFYVSVYGPPEELGIMARAAINAGGTLPLYPTGEATVRKVGEETVKGTHVTAYEIGGLGFTPVEIWLDDQLDFFGLVSAWSSTIREGFEAGAKQLIDAQDKRAAARTGDLARRFTHAPTGNRLSVVNARVFDPRTGTLSAPTIVNVEGNRIASIGTPMQWNAADVIDATGKVLLPGLWDMHVHMGDTDGLLNIAAGITSARDLGNDSASILELKRKIDAGEAVGPRLVLSGLVDGPGPFQGPTNLLAGDEAAAKKAIDFLADNNYEGLKIYSSIKPELVPFMTNYAHERGLRVSGHIPAGMRATDAVDAGYDEIQHVNMLFLNFMPDVTETRTPSRFTEVGKRAVDLDLNAPEVRTLIAKLRERGIVVDPTLTVFEGLFTSRLGQLSPSYAMIAERMPPQVRRYFLTGGLPVPEGMDQRYRASFRRMLDFIAELHRSGVTIVAGTDGLSGFTLHRELELYEQAGIAPKDVLRIATLTAAEVTKRDRDLGTIEPGKLADFILVDGDPTVNISDIRRITTVVKDGKVFRPREIYAELGIRASLP